MKRFVLAMLFGALLLPASAAYAVGPDPLDLSADCDGWAIDGYMYFGGSTQVDWTYWLSLIQGTDTLYQHSASGTLYSQGTFHFDGMWGEEFCGELKAYVVFMWVGEYGPGFKKAEVPFTCDCDEPGGCTYTPGYWKNHPDEWPVDHLTVGGVEYSQFRLLQIFDTPTGGDITVILFHHLVAAKLNVLSGSDPSIQPTIDAADAYLMDYPLFSRPRGAAKDMGEALKDELCYYNELPCPEDDMDEMLGASPRELLNAPAATEETSWGALKKKIQ